MPLSLLRPLANYALPCVLRCPALFCVPYVVCWVLLSYVLRCPVLGSAAGCSRPADHPCSVD
eukprot:COSAG06_NODE_3367_length_5442_cov_3.104810_8_plen_62_part_00